MAAIVDSEEKLLSDLLTVDPGTTVPRPYRIPEETLRAMRAKEYAKGSHASVREKALDNFLKNSSAEIKARDSELETLTQTSLRYKLLSVCLGAYAIMTTAYLISLIFFRAM